MYIYIYVAYLYLHYHHDDELRTRMHIQVGGEADVFLRLVHIGSGRDSEFMDQFAEPV